MSYYKCSKCSAEANSKCAASRSVFLTGQKDRLLVTLIGNMVTYGVSKRYENSHVPTVEISLHGASYPRNRQMTKEEREAAGEKDYWARTPVEPPPYREQRDKEEKEAYEFLRGLKDLDDGSLRQALCDHRWELQDDTCELGCCTRKAA